MSLIEALERGRGEPLTLARPLPPEPRVARAAAAVVGRMERIATLEPVDLVALRGRIEGNPDLATLGPRDFKHLAHLIWDSFPLGANPDFVVRYLEEHRRRASGPALRRLALQWLLRFAPGAPAIAESAALLRATSTRLRGPLSDPQVAGRVFDVAGPTTLAKELTETAESPTEILDRYGLRGPAAEGGFVQAAFIALLVELRRALATPRSSHLPLLGRVLDFARDAKGVPRFDHARAHLAEALLRPFAAADPLPETRELIEAELLTRLGDPRLAIDRWAGVNNDAKAVMVRWLAEATLEAFLAIVQKYADPGHWRYREAFWRAYLRAGYIRSVQVAFRPQAAEEARRLARKDRRLLAFARLGGAGTLANHAVLLLCIGDLTLAEWSHNGALRIWRRGHRSAPRLTDRDFDGPELRTPADLRVVHKGQWQAEVANFVWRETGLRVRATDYMPRR